MGSESVALSVILPCYNEAEALPGVIEDWLTSLAALEAELRPPNGGSRNGGSPNIELIVVDDGSRDETPKILQPFLGSFLRTIRHSTNLGYGEALKTGLKNARGEWIAFYDCDGTCSAASLTDLWKHRATADLVVGRRMGDQTRMPATRRFGNGLYQAAFSLLFLSPSHDVCSGYRLFHKKWAKDFSQHLPNQLNFTLAMSVWMTKRGLKIQQVPISYADRRGTSKLSVVRDGFGFLLTLLKFRFRSI